MSLTLGINGDSINYEVALEVLGQSRQPFMQAIHLERQQPMPSQAFIKFCQARLSAIDDLQEELQPTDQRTTLSNQSIHQRGAPLPSLMNEFNRHSAAGGRAGGRARARTHTHTHTHTPSTHEESQKRERAVSNRPPTYVRRPKHVFTHAR